MNNFTKMENESNCQFVKRMVRAKIDGVFTGTYSEWIKTVFGKEHSEDVSRREYYGCKMFVASMDEDAEDDIESSAEDFLDELHKRELEIDKKRMKLSDEFTYVNRIKREIARTETIGEYAISAASIVKDFLPFVESPHVVEKGTNKAVLCLSDWHYGLDYQSAFNVFNPDVATVRLQKLLDAVASDITRFDVDEIIVANLGDLISGIIHTTIRIENRVDVITQVIQVSELLAEFLFELSKIVPTIRYYSVIDNHGRIFANKKDNLDKENFNRMIDFYLKERFKDVDNVSICDNEIDETIMHFAVYNWAFVGTHGHDDNPNTALNDLSNLLHIDYNVCLLGHRHSPSLSESYGDLTIANGCLCGIDTYAKSIRRSARPSQNLIIVSEKNPCEFLHVIDLGY